MATHVDPPEQGSLVAACVFARHAGGVQVHSHAHSGQAYPLMCQYRVGAVVSGAAGTSD